MTISRRGFLKGALAGTVAAGTARGATHKRFEGYEGRVGLLHDTTLCVGCRSCEFACNRVHDLPPPAEPVGSTRPFEKKRRTTEGRYTVVNRYEQPGDQPAVFRKHQCMHCNEPCCASVCFVNAFEKTPEGPVYYHPELCVGCRYCVFACPYNALAYEYEDPATPRVVRCDMCYQQRIQQGEIPACAQACPTGAIVFGKRADLIKLAHDRMRKYPGRYLHHVFGENEYGGTSWLTLAGVEFGKLDLPENLPYQPLPTTTTSFLSLAPLVAAMFPGLLAGIYAFSKRKDKDNEKALEAGVAQARQEADEQRKKQVEELKAKAEKDKQRAVDRAVKKAIKEAEQARAAGDGEGKEGGS